MALDAASRRALTLASQIRWRSFKLDFDATDDPLQGAQEGAFFHGYDHHYCYLPLYVFCCNVPLLAKLRDCKRDASDGTVEALEKMVPAR